MISTRKSIEIFVEKQQHEKFKPSHSFTDKFFKNANMVVRKLMSGQLIKVS